jgi:hypothetical protein
MMISMFDKHLKNSFKWFTGSNFLTYEMSGTALHNSVFFGRGRLNCYETPNHLKTGINFKKVKVIFHPVLSDFL